LPLGFCADAILVYFLSFKLLKSTAGFVCRFKIVAHHASRHNPHNQTAAQTRPRNQKAMLWAIGWKLLCIGTFQQQQLQKKKQTQHNRLSQTSNPIYL